MTMSESQQMQQTISYRPGERPGQISPERDPLGLRSVLICPPGSALTRNTAFLWPHAVKKNAGETCHSIEI